MGSDVRVARSSRTTTARPTFSHQPFAGGAKSFDYARAHERLSELSVSFRRKTRVRPDHYVREPARRKNVRTLRVQGFESSGDHKIQSILSRVRLSQHGDQEFGDVRPTFSLFAHPRIVGKCFSRDGQFRLFFFQTSAPV